MTRDETMNPDLHCPHCSLVLRPESNWPQVNYCRGLTLLPWIEQRPGLSAWELSQVSGMGYSQVSKGVAKLRALEIIRGEPEQREVGGFRYRYYVWPDHAARVARLEAMMRLPVVGAA